MRYVRALGLILAASFFAMPAKAQEREEGAGNPITLGKVAVQAGERTIGLDKLAGSGRITAVRLQLSSGSCTVERVIISYASGQVHFEDREIILNERGRRSALIDPRADGKLINSIQVLLKSGACAAGLEIEVEGIEEVRAVKKAAGGKKKSRGFSYGTPPPASAPSAPRSAPEDRSAPMTRSAAPPKPFVEVAIYYGTTREIGPERQRDNITMASYGPGPHPESKMSLGRAVVTVPTEGRQPGQINRPQLSVLSFGREDEDPSRHFTIYRVNEMTEAEFKGAALFGKKAEGGRFKDHAFVFVHGYNVSFDDAVFRGAQLAFDMDFDGLPFIFSWPSRSNAAGYVLDKDRAFEARHALAKYIDIIRQIMGANAKNIHFIGHSMGSLPLMEALSGFDAAATSGPLFGQVIFAASDVVPESFRGAITRIAKSTAGTTLYASSNDWALTISKAFRLGVPPVGFVPSGGMPFVAPGIDTVDVSALDTSFWARNHSTYGDRKPLIDDMVTLFRETVRRPPNQRDENFRIETLPRNTGTFWRYARQ